jgi:hypothetical protein
MTRKQGVPWSTPLGAKLLRIRHSNALIPDDVSHKFVSDAMTAASRTVRKNNDPTSPFRNDQLTVQLDIQRCDRNFASLIQKGAKGDFPESVRLIQTLAR